MSLSDNQRLAMYTPAEIGKAIQRKRKAKKINQKEFAKLLDKSERTIQKYESGEIELSVGMLKLIADELDTPWQELLEAKPEDEAEEIINVKKYTFRSLADIISALFTMKDLTAVTFETDCCKPPENPEWLSSLSVNGKENGKYNADFCLFMDNWIQKQKQLASGKITQEKFEKWQNETLKYYADSLLIDGSEETNS